MSRWSFILLLAVAIGVLPGCTLSTSQAPDSFADPSPDGVVVQSPDSTGGSYEYRDDPRVPQQGTRTETVTVRLALPSTSAGFPDVLTPWGRFEADEAGLVEVPVADAMAPVTPILLDPATSEPMAIAYIEADGDASERVLGAQEILLGCMYLNPSLVLTPASARDDLLRSAPSHPEFGPLLSETESLFAANPASFLTRSVETGLFERATQLSVDIAAPAAEARAALGEDTGAPYINDLPGPEIEFVNPRLCAYGVEIRDEAGEFVDDAVVYGKQSLMVVQDEWPPVAWRDPVRLPHDLGDGRFSVTFYKGFNFMTLGLDTLDPETAAGRATIVNMLNLVSLLPGGPDFASDLIDTIEANMPDGVPDGYLPLEILDAADWLLTNLDDLAALQGLEANIGNYSLVDVIEGLIEFVLVDNNLDSLAQGLWDSLPPEATGPFLMAFQKIMRIVDVVFTVIDYANMGAPFIYDFVAAPFITEYEISQTEGVLLSVAAAESHELAAPPRRSVLAGAR